jgi:excisionase family DNA binding protein
MLATEHKLLTVREVASYLRVDTSTVRRLIANGELRALQLGGPGHSLRIAKHELEDWLSERHRPARNGNGD